MSFPAFPELVTLKLIWHFHCTSGCYWVKPSGNVRNLKWLNFSYKYPTRHAMTPKQSRAASKRWDYWANWWAPYMGLPSCHHPRFPWSSEAPFHRVWLISWKINTVWISKNFTWNQFSWLKVLKKACLYFGPCTWMEFGFPLSLQL